MECRREAKWIEVKSIEVSSQLNIEVERRNLKCMHVIVSFLAKVVAGWCSSFCGQQCWNSLGAACFETSLDETEKASEGAWLQDLLDEEEAITFYHDCDPHCFF